MKRSKTKQIDINREWCKGCGICVTFCPTQVLELDQNNKAVAVRMDDCTACMLCELRCPDLAIDVHIETAPPKTEK